MAPGNGVIKHQGQLFMYETLPSGELRAQVIGGQPVVIIPDDLRAAIEADIAYQTRKQAS